MNMPGGPEIMVILVIALLVLGPEQLPKAMRTFGNAMAEIRKISGGFQAEMRKAMDEIDPRVDDKPQSAPMASAKPAEITEVVARNTAPTDVLAAETRPTLPEPAPSEPGTSAAATDLPSVDPADRAAG